jgi:hypothetical protein
MAPEHEAVVAMKAGPVPSRKRCHHDGGANGPRTEQQEHHGLCSQNGGERKRDKRGGVAPHRKGPEREAIHAITPTPFSPPGPHPPPSPGAEPLCLLEPIMALCCKREAGAKAED